MMKIKTIGYLLCAGAMAFACTKQQPKPSEPLTPVPFTAVHFTDGFWAPKIEINRTVSIPSAFQKCEENGRLDNFALAGGLIEGEQQGDFPFDDTDVYKVLEGASYALAVQYDPQLDHYLDSVINLIDAAQEDDGYLTTCVTNKAERLKGWWGSSRWERLNSHELYNSGHLYEAAVAHYLATGKRTLLDIALKNADLVDQVFGPGENQKHVPSGHPIIEMALVKLYRVTNDEKYLKLARYFIDETGKGTDGHQLSEYSQDHKPIVDQDEAVGHAVRLGYLYSGVTDVASLQHDAQLMDATKRVWENVVSKKLYITGGIGSRAQGEGFGPNYELPNMTSYCETCASISNVYWNYRLFLNEHDAKYYDVLERVLYNGVISGVSLSGDKFFYDNPLESLHNHDRAPWFGCACCPSNITRFMASIPGYMYATDSQAVYVNLFAESNAKVPFGRDTVAISQTTKYPWNGDVVIKIDQAASEKMKLKIRIPGWAQNQPVPSDLYHFANQLADSFTLEINGEKENATVENGYVSLAKKWKSGDEITLNFPMPVRKIVANENVPNDKGKLAYQRGPVVYCFEDKDNGNGFLFDCFAKTDEAVEAQFEPDLLGGVVKLQLKGERVQLNEGEKELEPVSLTAIPYYAWDNRGTSNMLVWLADEEDAVVVKPEASVSTNANASASSGWAPGLNDGFDPKSSGDVDKSYFYWWLKEGSEEWVQYEFEKPVTLSRSDVYWLDMTHYDGNYRVPQSWKLEVKDSKGNWVPVETTDAYGVALDQYNTVNFKPVKTSAVRLQAKLQEGESAGILEWKLN
ncbi:beta-L-arabinofuranosidase domain-containing protein [Mangrovibacterium marinum]|uniref:glycoside hydrolase family 127 protein n=1 Tax=Mangrovibacterium marinum TaxID=1639118 RepID=UPI002A18E873|nr:beta-L-arabinofuranosidase domain-containing protein [Mangrovibacterium marinum]